MTELYSGKKYFHIDSDKKAYLISILVLLLVYWPITFLQYNFKWDMTDVFLPWRHHVSLSLQNFELPLWNAHQSGGYPIVSDPQSSALYPVVWLLTFIFGKYNIYAVHTEFLLTATIASIGFYKLCRFFSVSIPMALCGGLMYACSGIFIGNGQHLSWLVSSAYLPVTLYCFFSLSTTLRPKYLLLLSLALYMGLSGGYPAFAFVLFYLLIIFFIHFAIRHYKGNTLKKYFSYSAAAAVLTLVFASALLFSFYTLKPLISRGDGVTLDVAMQNAFTLPSFLSFVVPLATGKHNEILGTDISMANGYIGLFFLLALPLFFMRSNKTALEKIILLLALVFLAASVGEVLPVRKWLFQYVPLMDYFRFPSLFRIFVVLFLLLLACIQLDRIKNNLAPYLKVAITGGGIISILLLFAWAKNNSVTGMYDFFFNRATFNQHSTIFDHIIIQGSIQLVLILLFLLLYRWDKGNKTTILYSFLLLDLFLSVQLNLPYTVLAPENDPLELNKKIEAQPSITHIPVKEVWQNNDFDLSLQPLWKNLHDYILEFSYDGWNAFMLRKYETLLESKFSETLIHNYPIYIVKKHISTTDTTSLVPDSIHTTRIALASPDLTMAAQQWQASPEDTCRFLSISSNTMQLESSTQDTALVALFQNYVPGWHCRVNGVPTDIQPINISLMGVIVPPGLSTISLEYNPTGIRALITISFVSQFLAGLLIGILYWRSYKNESKAAFKSS
jgi:hypothetical protein